MNGQRENMPRDEAFQVLALHDWDAVEALRSVLAERDAIEERLTIARLIIGGTAAPRSRRRTPGQGSGRDGG
jgi:predicted nucleotidyltransferase